MISVRLAGCLLGAALFSLDAEGPPEITVGVRNLTTTVASVDGERIWLHVRFDAVLPRHASRELHIAAGPAEVIGVERLREGQWRTTWSGHWYVVEFAGENKYPACTAGPAKEGEVFTLPGIKSSVVSLAKTDEAVRTGMNVRFHIETFCREDAGGYFSWLVTEPIDLKIPDRERAKP